MTIKTTRLKATQTPRIRTMDLSDQMNGSRQTFSLPRRIQTWDTHYLVWNSTVYRNDRNHRFYSISEDGYSLTTYFDTAPVGGAGRTLQLAYSSGGDGEDDVLTKAEVNKLVNDEAEARKAADEALGVRIDEEAEARRAADAEEKLAREQADEAERQAREAGDANLQSQLDAAAAASDVVDIVDTKAELDAYNKSALTDKDVIKVLRDETQSSATTYYRFDKPSNNFNLIGAVGPYYTQSEVNNITNNITNNMNANLEHCIKNNVSTEQTMVGDLRLKKNGSNYDTKLSFGDGDYASIYEYEDDKLRIKGSTINLAAPSSNIMIGANNPVSLASLLSDAGSSIDYINYEGSGLNGPVELRIGEKSKNGFLKLYIGDKPMSTALNSGSDAFLYMRGGSVAIGSIKLPTSDVQYESNSYTNGDKVMIGSSLEGVTSGPAGLVNLGDSNRSGEGAVLIGRGWTGAKDAVAIGYNTYNKTITERSVSIGHGAGATTQHSVALGAYSSTSRADELSIGGDYYWYGSQRHITRYIANVKAGTLDTDAVNFKQMKDYVAANAGSSYTLPVASASVLGGIKVGSGLSIAADGTLSATGGSTDLSNYYTKTEVDNKITTNNTTVITPLQQKLARIPNMIIGSTGDGGDPMFEVAQSVEGLSLGYKQYYTDTDANRLPTVVIFPKATATANGVMSKEDKAKLDSLDVPGQKTVREGHAVLTEATGDLQLYNCLPDNWLFATVEVTCMPTGPADTEISSLVLSNGSSASTTNGMYNPMLSDAAVTMSKLAFTLAKNTSNSNSIAYVGELYVLADGTARSNNLGAKLPAGSVVNGFVIPYAAGNISYKITVVTGE